MGDFIDGGTGGDMSDADRAKLAEYIHEVRTGMSDPKTPNIGEFRQGGEAPDVVDEGVAMFVGDPRAREVIKNAGIDSVPAAEEVVDALAKGDAAEMGTPHQEQPGIDEIIARYEREMGEN